MPLLQQTMKCFEVLTLFLQKILLNDRDRESNEHGSQFSPVLHNTGRGLFLRLGMLIIVHTVPRSTQLSRPGQEGRQRGAHKTNGTSQGVVGFEDISYKQKTGLHISTSSLKGSVHILCRKP